MKNHIDVITSTSYAAREAATSIIEGLGGAEIVKAVRLNTKKTLPNDVDSPDRWPCIFECLTDKEGLWKVEIRIFSLTSGYGGTGPHDLYKLLEFAGFNSDELTEAIFLTELDCRIEK